MSELKDGCPFNTATPSSKVSATPNLFGAIEGELGSCLISSL